MINKNKILFYFKRAYWISSNSRASKSDNFAIAKLEER